MNKNYLEKDFSGMSPKAIESWILKISKATPTENGTKGIDGTRMTKSGNLEKLEVKVHGLNRCSLGVVDLTKNISQNLKNLLVADKYIHIRPQGVDTDNRPFILIMSHDEMAKWCFERVVLDRNRHKKPKFKINFFERSKKQDRKFADWGMVIA